MHTPFLHHRYTEQSSRERRLCHEQTGGRSLEESAHERTRVAAKWFKENVGYNVSDTVVGALEGLKDAWGGAAPTEIQREVLRGAVEFFRDAPETFLDIMQSLENTNVETIKAMTSHHEWLNAWTQFSAAPKKFKSVSAVKPGNNEAFGPLRYIESLTEAEQKTLYTEYITHFIPEDVQQLHEDVFGKPPTDRETPVQRAERMIAAGHIGNIQSALRLLMGDEDPELMGCKPEDIEWQLARESLEHHYFDPARKLTGEERGTRNFSVDPTDARFDTLQYSLLQDYTNLFRRDPSLTRTDMTDVKRFALLSNNLPSSRMRGLMRLRLFESVPDVPPEVLLSALYRSGREQWEVEKSRKRAQTTEEVRTLTRADQRERARESRTTADVWRNLPGWQKLILIVGLIYGAKSAPGAAMALGAVYFGQKFFLKQDQPAEGWAKTVQHVLEKFSGPLAAIGVPVGSETADDSAERANIAVEFLAEQAREELDCTATGLVLIAKMKVRDLAMCFDGFEEGGKRTTTLLENGQTLISYLRGYDRQAMQKFLSRTENTQQLEDLLPSIFYLLGGRENPRDKHCVEVALGRTSTGKFDEIEGLERALFEHLAVAGKDLAHRSGDVTVLELIKEAIYTPVKPAEITIEEFETHPAYLAQKKQIEKYTYAGVNANLRVRYDRAADRVIIDSDGASYPLPLEKTRRQFVNDKAADLIAEWVGKGYNKKKAAMATMNCKPFPTPLVLELDREIVRYHVPFAGAVKAAADTPAYVFLPASIDDVHTKYYHWCTVNWPLAGMPAPGAPAALDSDPF